MNRIRALHVLHGLALAMALVASESVPAQETEAVSSPYARWNRGPPGTADYFPIAVWLQDPRDAARYKAAGVNLYVGLWKGPTEEQLSELEKTGMQVICAQNQVGLRHRGGRTIVGWMHGDEPDNAQSLRRGKGYGPPIPPEKIVEDYERYRSRDPSRPILLNLGQGVAWDGWHGRGVRTNHPEDYPEYVKGGDIVSFDIYPVVHRSPEVAGKLEFVARGVDRLREWSAGRRIVWNCIESTRISNTKVKPTPHQVRAEVWMSLVHGSRGLIYFVHQFQPTFDSKALFADPAMLEMVTRTNKEIHRLAPVLNRPAVEGKVHVKSSRAGVPVDVLVKEHEGKMYIFSVSMRGDATTATFSFVEESAPSSVEVLGENRSLEVPGGSFQDRFAGYDVHLYRSR